MPGLFQGAFVADLLLLAVEEFVPLSHQLLPLCDNHLWQLASLVLFAYLYVAVRLALRGG